jgi:beta-glucosidase
VSVAGTGSVEVALDGGPAVAVLSPDAPTAGPYAYVDLESAFTTQGVHDLRIRLRGALRLAHVGFSG